jgi:hypothetical protein
LTSHNDPEFVMYARRISMHLKPNCVPELTRKLNMEVIPLLRKQAGFQDEITFIGSDGKEAFAISLWDRKESAETYSKQGYPEVTKLLAPVLDGTAKVETYEVSNSTFHKLSAAA